MRPPRIHPAVRNGFTYLELQVAFLLFAIALGGLVPLAVVQSRQARRMESRFDPANTHYLVASASPWARKLGAAAAVSDQAAAASAPPLLFIDDGDTGYAEHTPVADNWSPVAAAEAYGDTCRSNSNGAQGDKASWLFTGLQPGSYQVLAAYPPTPSAATDAPYRIYEAAVLLHETRVDQQQAPSGPSYEGVLWENLGTVSISQTELLVELHDDANGSVVADAVRLVAERNDVQVLSVSKSLDQEAVSTVVTVTSP